MWIETREQGRDRRTVLTRAGATGGEMTLAAAAPQMREALFEALRVFGPLSTVGGPDEERNPESEALLSMVSALAAAHDLDGPALEVERDLAMIDRGSDDR